MRQRLTYQRGSGTRLVSDAFIEHLVNPRSARNQCVDGTLVGDTTLRDDNARHYHRCVRLADSPWFVELSWRANANSAVHRVGLCELDLPKLLKAGHIRRERADSDEEVRLRFFSG